MGMMFPELHAVVLLCLQTFNNNNNNNNNNHTNTLYHALSCTD